MSIARKSSKLMSTSSVYSDGMTVSSLNCSFTEENTFDSISILFEESLEIPREVGQVFQNKQLGSYFKSC